jgi:hypothetical protein
MLADAPAGSTPSSLLSVGDFVDQVKNKAAAGEYLPTCGIGLHTQPAFS